MVMTNSLILGSVFMFLIGLTARDRSEGQQLSPVPTGKSEWISVNTEGKLVYKKTERGDQVMDFSHAGYMGGGRFQKLR